MKNTIYPTPKVRHPQPRGERLSRRGNLMGEFPTQVRLPVVGFVRREGLERNPWYDLII